MLDLGEIAVLTGNTNSQRHQFLLTYCVKDIHEQLKLKSNT
jgi:hypothetical protein